MEFEYDKCGFNNEAIIKEMFEILAATSEDTAHIVLDTLQTLNKLDSSFKLFIAHLGS